VVDGVSAAERGAVSTERHAASEFVVAVCAGDVAAVSALVDWPASGVARMVRALHETEPGERADTARRGLAALATEGLTQPISLTWLAPCVGAEVVLDPATPAQEAVARAALDTPELPREVDTDVGESLTAIADRARRVEHVYSVRCGNRIPCLLAVGPAIQGVAVARLAQTPMRAVMTTDGANWDWSDDI
jgi:hypothetical protein